MQRMKEEAADLLRLAVMRAFRDNPSVTGFEKNLAAIIGRPSTQRPFVCSGYPYACPVWVVGYNAATTGGDWWRFWSADSGFDLAAWRKDYDAERASRRKGASATRLRIDRMRASVPNVLETNIFSAPSTRMSNMPGNSTEAFDLLLATFAPRTIIVHGVPAANHLAAWTGGRLIVCPHLSRAGYKTVQSVIEKVKNIGDLRK